MFDPIKLVVKKNMPYLTLECRDSYESFLLHQKQSQNRNYVAYSEKL